MKNVSKQLKNSAQRIGSFTRNTSRFSIVTRVLTDFYRPSPVIYSFQHSHKFSTARNSAFSQPKRIQKPQSLKSLRSISQEEFSLQKELLILRKDLITAYHESNFSIAEKAYLQIREAESKYSKSRFLLKTIQVNYDLFLACCSTESHTDYVYEVMKFLEKYSYPITEQCCYALIRCYADANDLDNVVNTFKTMKKYNIEPRARNFHPLFALCYRNQNLAVFIDSVFLLQEYGLLLKLEELYWFLLTINTVRRQKKKNQPSFQDLTPKIHQILTKMSQELLGMNSMDLVNLVKEFDHLSYEEIKEKGILVNQKEDLSGPIVSMDGYEQTGSLLALNARFEDAATYITRSTSVKKHNPHHHQQDEDVKFFPTKYVDGVKRQEILQRQLLFPSCVKRSTKRLVEPEKSLAKLVHISNHTRQCPHCQAELMKFHINEEQKQQVRQELYQAVEKSHPNLIHHLEAFEAWLENKDFNFVIDGANVAYANLNHPTGRFSYKQIEIMVDKLVSMGKKPLVILSHCYARPASRIPNSIQMVPTHVNDKERQFLAELTQKNMLYSVPDKIDDDWFWILASIHKHQKTPAYVVTNDFIRDHRNFFQESAAFFRWRNAQVVYFTIQRKWAQFNESGTLLKNDFSIDGEVHLFMPAECSRSIQYLEQSRRWHIPALDLNVWLCLDLNPLPVQHKS